MLERIAAPRASWEKAVPMGRANPTAKARMIKPGGDFLRLETLSTRPLYHFSREMGMAEEDVSGYPLPRI